MKKRIILTACLLGVLSLFAEDNIIWMDRPAQDWQQECLPIGNGRMGCMIYGGVEREHIQFNEDTVWIGDEADTGSYQAFGDLYVELGGITPPPSRLSNPSAHVTSTQETVAQSADGNSKTKWCMEHGNQAVVWQMIYESTPKQPLQGYSLTSANDQPLRDPRQWTLEGSIDGQQWTILDDQARNQPFEQRLMTKTFAFSNDTLFSHYRLTFQPLDTSHFQVADVALNFAESTAAASTRSYRRELNVDQALHRIQYRKDGVNYQREYFASNPANVQVFRLSADQQGAYTGFVSLKDAHGSVVKAAENKLTFSGTLAGTYKSPNDNYAIQLQYEAQVLVMHEGGSIEAVDGKIAFKDCDSLIIIMNGGTDYSNQRAQGWKQQHPHHRITQTLEKASKRSFDDLLKEHVEDYQALFNRVSVDLGKSSKASVQLPTPERLNAYRGAKVQHSGSESMVQTNLNKAGGAPDPDLEVLLFQFARYLMISSSRPGCMPANLQGLWNESNRPPWRSDYHTDVNLQMNYWFVDQANLSECFTPLSEWLWSVVPVKREATRKAFGVRGWAHRAENGIFGGASFKWYLGDGAWIMQNLWDHYAYTMDRDYLETRAYPLLKNLCEFWEDSLIEWPNGKLVSPKSQSPEHGPELEGNSYEQQLVYDLFTNYIEASVTLGKDQAFRQKVESMRARLLGPKIGSWGQLQEWADDLDNSNNKHRHLSHLIAVHPGRQISPVTTPVLAEAAKVSMNARGDGATGWSKAWKINIWARLHDGDRAYKLLSEQIKGNYYDNLLGFHPPFQIDGNFGYASGLCEMLVQSHMGVVHLLPSLPAAWPTGAITGLKARGGFEVDIEWQEGRLVQATLRSLNGNPCKVRYGAMTKEIELKVGESRTLSGTDFE
jgi:alpha-L-fucosidase 2